MTGILNILAGSISSAIKDGYFNLVSLLLPGNGTNGAQNNTFLDSSSNNFTITRNGNTTQGTFSPFSQTGWSNYFDGSGDYLSVADNAALDMGSSNFTIEGFVYITATPSTAFLFGKRASAAVYGGVTVQFSGNTTPILLATVDGSSWGVNVTSSVSVALNSWAHIAVTRSGNTWAIWVNGVSGGSATLSGTVPDNSSAFTVCAGSADGGSVMPACYVSNFRVVKGTAVYTSAFTPSTTPLTAITNTSLLTCSDNRFIDGSTNAFTVTPSGNVSVQAFSPFAPTAAYSAATNGGSGYFDGTGDYLSAASNTAFAFGTGDFTWEAWVYRGASATQEIYTTMVTNGFIIYILSNKLVVRQFGVADRLTSSADVTLNTWTHIAVARSGTTLSLWLNGSRTNGGTVTNSNDFAQSGIRIGINDVGASAFTGYISGMRVVKGTAVYDPTQTSITVPTAPPTAVTNTQFLLNFTNAGITDATAKNVLETVGNAQISTTQSKFGGSSMSFDGTGDYLTIPSNQLLGFGTGDFTIEFWVYRNNTTAETAVIDARPVGATDGYAIFFDASNKVAWLVGGSVAATGSTTISSGSWYHIAVARSGSTVKIFVNGTQDASATSSTDAKQNGVTIGAKQQSGSSLVALNGYIDDLRITKGYARYTANFTPPTAAFALQ